MRVDYENIFASKNPLNLIIQKDILTTNTLNMAVFLNKTRLVKDLIACRIKVNRYTCKNIQSIEVLKIINENISEKRWITSCVSYFDNKILEFIGKNKLQSVDICFVNGHELAIDAITTSNIERLKIVLKYFPIYKSHDAEDLFSIAMRIQNFEMMELIVRFGKLNYSTMSRDLQLAICDAYYKIKYRLCQNSIIASSMIRERIQRLNCSNSSECFKLIQEEGLHEEYSKVIGLNEKEMKENTMKLINEINNSL